MNSDIVLYINGEKVCNASEDRCCEYASNIVLRDKSPKSIYENVIFDIVSNEHVETIDLKEVKVTGSGAFGNVFVSYPKIVRHQDIQRLDRQRNGVQRVWDVISSTRWIYSVTS